MPNVTEDHVGFLAEQSKQTYSQWPIHSSLEYRAAGPTLFAFSFLRWAKVATV